MRLNESIVVAAPPKLVWDYIADPDNALHFHVRDHPLGGRGRAARRPRRPLSDADAGRLGRDGRPDRDRRVHRAARLGVVVGHRGRPARPLAPAQGRRRPHQGRVPLRLRRRRRRDHRLISERVSAPSVRSHLRRRCSSSSARSSTSSCARTAPAARPSAKPRLPRRRRRSAPLGAVEPRVLAALLPVHRSHELLLVHLRAPGDVQLRRLVVELLAGAPARRLRRPERLPPRRPGGDVVGRAPRRAPRFTGSRPLLVHRPRRDLLGRGSLTCPAASGSSSCARTGERAWCPSSLRAAAYWSSFGRSPHLGDTRFRPPRTGVMRARA